MSRISLLIVLLFLCSLVSWIKMRSKPCKPSGKYSKTISKCCSGKVNSEVFYKCTFFEEDEEKPSKLYLEHKDDCDAIEGSIWSPDTKYNVCV